MTAAKTIRAIIRAIMPKRQDGGAIVATLVDCATFANHLYPQTGSPPCHIARDGESKVCVHLFLDLGPETFAPGNGHHGVRSSEIDQENLALDRASAIPSISTREPPILENHHTGRGTAYTA